MPRAAALRAISRKATRRPCPFAAEAFDFIVCRAAFKNFSDPVGALREMHRVLGPGGGRSSSTCATTRSGKAIVDEVAKMHLGRIDAFLTRTALSALRKRAYSKADFERMAQATPFGDVTSRSNRSASRSGWSSKLYLLAARSPVERQRNPGVASQCLTTPSRISLKFIIGPARGRTRWLNPGYAATLAWTCRDALSLQRCAERIEEMAGAVSQTPRRRSHRGTPLLGDLQGGLVPLGLQLHVASDTEIFLSLRCIT